MLSHQEIHVTIYRNPLISEKVSHVSILKDGI